MYFEASSTSTVLQFQVTPSTSNNRSVLPKRAGHPRLFALTASVVQQDVDFEVKGPLSGVGQWQLVLVGTAIVEQLCVEAFISHLDPSSSFRFQHSVLESILCVLGL